MDGNHFFTEVILYRIVGANDHQPAGTVGFNE
jgi:hypothetical protein